MHPRCPTYTLILALALIPVPWALAGALAQDAPPAPPEADAASKSDPEAVAAIDKYLQAIGGKESLASIKDRVVRFVNKKFSPTTVNEMKIARFMQRPFKLREEWEMQGMNITKEGEPLRFLQVYDGEEGWVKTMGFVSRLGVKNLTVFVWDKYLDDFFASWQENGYTGRFLGESELGDKPVMGVELESYAGAQKIKYYFSKENGLLLRKEWTEGSGNTGPVHKEVLFEEYQKVRFRNNPEQWIRIATRQKIFEDGELSLEKVYTDIIINGGLSAGIFGRPDGQDFDKRPQGQRPEGPTSKPAKPEEGGAESRPAKKPEKEPEKKPQSRPGG